MAPVNTNFALFNNSQWRTLLLAGTVFAFGAVLTEARASTRWETLEAIHTVENPSNRQSPGPCGELGAYQFRLDTWRMYSHRPFSEALDRRSSDEVAVRHYDWLKATLERAGFEASVYNIALAWNAGVGAVTSGRIPASSRDYASRVSNIAAELQVRALQQVFADAH
ncbi:MAG TPA: hypothetical protein VG838_02315 [Opitutaceae bacterium]|nr:hypothetical protein [Opitutaceae bacterium]